MKKIINLLLLLLTTSILVVAQYERPQTKRISINNGLSDRFVNRVFQDSRGFIWIACNYGLNRYDGVQIKNYTKEDNNLKSNKIHSVIQFTEDLLIIIHQVKEDEKALYYRPYFTLFHSKKEEVLTFEEVFGNQVKENQIQYIGNGAIVDIENNVYISEVDNNLKIRLKPIAKLPGPIDYYYQKQQSYSKEVFLVYKDSLTNLSQIYKLSSKGLEKKHSFELGESFSSKSLYLLHEDKLGNIYYSIKHTEITEGFDEHFLSFTNYLTFKLDNNGLVHPFSLKGAIKPSEFYHDAEVRAIFLEDLKICLVPIEQRFDIFDWDGNLITSTDKVLPFLDLIDYYIDDNNRIWLSTGDGAYIVDFKSELFTKHHNNPNVDAFDTPGDKGNAMRGICDDAEGNLWLCQENGIPMKPLLKVDMDGNVRIIDVFTKAQQDYFKENRAVPCFSIARDPQAQLWIADDHSGLFKMNPKTEDFKRYTYLGYHPKTTGDRGLCPATRAIYIDETTGKIWLGHSKGLSFLDTTKTYLEYYKGVEGLEELRDVYCFHKNAQGFWIGSATGLYLLDTKSGKAVRYSNQDTGAYSFPNAVVTHIYEDKEGVFWMTSNRGGGLLKWNPKTKLYKKYTVKDGLSNNVTYAVYGDGFDNLWISSNRGIMKMNRALESFNHYLPKDGLPHVEFNTGSHYQAANGKIYFGGLNGIVEIDPQKFNQSEASYNAQLQISSYNVLDKSNGVYINNTASLLQQQSINLSGNYQAFVLKVALLDYFAPEQNSYAYILEGLEEHWNYIDENTIQISNLPYGNYTLKIKGRGTGGLWSKNELAIPITVPMPFYMQWWFLFIVVAVLVGLVLSFVNWRLKRLRTVKEELEKEVKKRTEKIEQQTEELKALDKVKSRFFANISHELRTPL